MEMKNKSGLSRLFTNKITIISGHFGCGKTNIAVNAARDAARVLKKPVRIADLDIVNPYFRTADNEELLKEYGIKTLIPPYANTNVDIPSLPDDMGEVFYGDGYSVIDLGGDPDGAAALGCDRDRYIEVGYDMYYVCNFYRPETHTVEGALYILKEIEKACRMKFSGIINNSNLGAETKLQTVTSTFEKANELSKLSGLPIEATTAVFSLPIENSVVIENITKRLF